MTIQRYKRCDLIAGLYDKMVTIAANNIDKPAKKKTVLEFLIEEIDAHETMDKNLKESFKRTLRKFVRDCPKRLTGNLIDKHNENYEFGDYAPSFNGFDWTAAEQKGFGDYQYWNALFNYFPSAN